MTKPGQKSAAELAVAPLIEIQPRPVAPVDLRDDEAREWDAIIARMPADWLTREQYPLLTQYCRLIFAARRLSMLIEQAEIAEEWDEHRWLSLQRAQRQTAASIASLATKMRFTHSARIGPERAATVARTNDEKSKPWEAT